MVAQVHVLGVDAQDLDLAGLVRHAVARPPREARPAGQGLLEDRPAPDEGNLVGLVAGRRAALEQVVRRAADVRELREQLGQRPRTVVDATDEGALVDADDAVADTGVDALDREVGQLAGVVEVGHQIDASGGGRVPAERRLQIGVAEDPVGIERRHLRADADDLHVGNRAQRLEDLHEPPGAHQQRVAAGQQHVGDLGMVGDVAQPLRHVVGGLVVLVHEEALAEAVAAVGPAHLVAQQQHRVGVLVLHPAGHGDRLLVAGVELAPLGQLLLARDDQLPDRVVRIVPVDQAEVVVVGAEDVARRHRCQPVPLLRRELFDVLELPDVLHALRAVTCRRTAAHVIRIKHRSRAPAPSAVRLRGVGTRRIDGPHAAQKGVRLGGARFRSATGRQAAFPSLRTPEFRMRFAYVCRGTRPRPPAHEVRGDRDTTYSHQLDPNPAGLGGKPGRARSRETSPGRCRLAGACRIGDSLGSPSGPPAASSDNSITTSGPSVKTPRRGSPRPRPAENGRPDRRI